MDWTCPHCGTPQAVTEQATAVSRVELSIGQFAELVPVEIGAQESPYLAVNVFAVRCAQRDCRKATITVDAYGAKRGWMHGSKMHLGEVFLTQQIYPGRVGKPFPAHVPPAMLQDYNEAWTIIDLSPKSSATLARRCLQAMIRDFCGIKERTLFLEIQKLEKLLGEDKLPRGVDPDTIEAMRALKDLGNVGAHMTEVDGVIVDVEPGEAEKLLSLIEMLFADWYVACGKRQERLAGIKALADDKKGAAPAGT